MGPAVTSTGNEVLLLVQLVTESISWHILIMQSFIKSVIPLGKKKKKSGPNDKQNMNVPLLKALQASISCISNVIGEVNKWVLDQLNKPEDHDLDVLMSHLAIDDSLGPSKVLNVFKDSLGVVDKSEVGDRIYDLVKSWDPTFVLRKIVRAQRKVLTDFSQICDSKLRVLESLKQSI
jgi:N-terminal acetyltransferase B complex non-catalytic subunit